MNDQQLIGNPIRDLSKRFLITFVLGILIYRLGSFVPVPGINAIALEAIVKDNGFLGYLNMFNGGAISNASIFGLGVMPYISASIIIQLLAMSVPALKAMQKEGEVGRRRLNQYTRYFTVAICLLQGGMAAYAITNWSSSGESSVPLVTMDSVPWFVVQGMLVITCGSMVLLWIAEQITKFGIGNGVSVIIMIGIVSRFPIGLGELWGKTTEGGGLEKFLGVAVVFVAIITVMVVLSTARRRINLEQQRRVQGNKIYGGGKTQLPLMLNQANVIPVIFASPIITVVGYLATALSANYLLGSGSPLNRYIFAGLIVFFTYFYISITLDLNDLANHFKQSGFFIRGIRPGRNTVEYIKYRLDRISFVGALVLAAISVGPPLLGQALDVSQNISYSLLGGIGLLIVVGVCLDVINKVMSFMLAHQYQGAMGALSQPGGKVRGPGASGKRRF
jgi:preprotein translocase subunit SecY